MKLDSKPASLSLRILTLAILSLFLFSCSAFGTTTDLYQGEAETIQMAVIWNGLSSIYPSSKTNNPVAEVVRQNTGVNMNFTFYDGYENDNLTRIFAIGKNMPDVIMAPYWGGGDANSATIRQAVADGLLIPVDEYLDDIAINLQDSWTVGVSENFQQLEWTAEEFGGLKYVIPMQTPASEADITNWGYTVFARKDIIEDLGVDPDKINTSDDLYELAKRIKAGNYKDINGNNIIVASTFANGWSYECYINSFRSRNRFTNVIQNDDGSLDWISSSELLEEEIRFMHKMISEGLFDKTAFSHNQSTVIQKHITGSVAMTATIYGSLKQMLKNTLYVDHPEMEYIPLGPIYDADGVAAMPDGYREESGEYGFPVLMITKDCKNPEAVMRYLNYINSEEGKLLSYLGIEGEDWEYNDDQEIVRTSLWRDSILANPNYGVERGTEYHYIGISQVPNRLISDVRNEDDEIYQKLLQMYPVQTVSGTYASSWDTEFPEIQYLRNILEAMGYKTTIESAYSANTIEQALTILNNYRNNLRRNGYLERYLEWLENKIKNEGDIIF
ncbi:MAG: extracellular solute-binding protein [Candidatus Izemoplasmatales bacterium]|jgi:putative aldouronate transport system substrate-binding protein|nr:extracellular solute-binding protein [Candidatus Izemoplasmatales bacterium]